MILVLVLIATAIALMLLAPIALTAGRWQVRFPRLALALWFGALTVGLFCVAGSVAVSVLTALGDANGGGFTETMAAWLGLALVGAMIAIIAGTSEPIVHSHRAELYALTPLVTSRQRRAGFVLARFDSDVAIACSVRRPEAMILLSSRAEEILTPAQLRAVLAHEYAHLRRRHDLVTRIAQINAACLPGYLPAGRALRRATGLLVELIADDVAARQAGAVNLANALVRLADDSADAGMLLRAERLSLRRWPLSRRCRLPEPIRV